MLWFVGLTQTSVMYRFGRPVPVPHVGVAAVALCVYFSCDASPEIPAYTYAGLTAFSTPIALTVAGWLVMRKCGEIADHVCVVVAFVVLQTRSVPRYRVAVLAAS